MAAPRPPWVRFLNACLFIGTLAVGVIAGAFLGMAEDIEDKFFGRFHISSALDADAKKRQRRTGDKDRRVHYDGAAKVIPFADQSPGIDLSRKGASKTAPSRPYLVSERTRPPL